MPIRPWHVALVVVGVLVLAGLSALLPGHRDARDQQTARYPWSAAPPTTTVQSPPAPAPPTTRSTCDVRAEVTYTREWIRSCHLLGKLTPECKQIFDSAGGYTAPERAGSSRLQQWTNDATACSCVLPGNVATQLNETLKSDKELCAIRFPEPSKK